MIKTNLTPDTEQQVRTNSINRASRLFFRVGSFVLFWCLVFGFWCLSPIFSSALGGRIPTGSITSPLAHPGHGNTGKMLKVTTREEDGITHVFVHNLEAADVTATFSIQLSNLKGSTNFPYTATFAGNQTVEAFTFTPIDPKLPWSYSYTDTFTIGSLTAVHDDSYAYLLPYAPGKTFRVTQGYHGSFSHTGPDEFAIDWKMPVGTPVHAARGGLVVKSKDDSDIGGPDRKYESCANCILIQHDDGTIGIYAHLKAGGNRVKVGDKVNAGDFIGLSGNTGFTSGPHLHFSVFKTASGRERVSLPVKFRTADSPSLTIASGESYRAGSIEVQQAGKNPSLAGSVSNGKHKPDAAEQPKPEQPSQNTGSAGGLPSGN